MLGALTNAMMLRSQTVGGFALWYSLLTVASLLTSVPFNALTMDVVPADARGFASGAIGSAQHGGNLIGALVSLPYAEFSPGALPGLFCDAERPRRHSRCDAKHDQQIRRSR